jgi:hypothetical protein
LAKGHQKSLSVKKNLSFSMDKVFNMFYSVNTTKTGIPQKKAPVSFLETDMTLFPLYGLITYSFKTETLFVGFQPSFQGVLPFFFFL